MALVPTGQGQQVVNPAPSIDVANQIVQNNNNEVNHNPGLAAAAIQSGSADTASALFATAHFLHMANAIDDHIKTYDSHVWIQNALKNVPDVAKALVPNPLEAFSMKVNQ